MFFYLFILHFSSFAKVFFGSDTEASQLIDNRHLFKYN